MYVNGNSEPVVSGGSIWSRCLWNLNAFGSLNFKNHHDIIFVYIELPEYFSRKVYARSISPSLSLSLSLSLPPSLSLSLFLSAIPDIFKFLLILFSRS